MDPGPARLTLANRTWHRLFSAAELDARAAECAAWVNENFTEVMLVPVLTGALRFTAAVLPHLQVPYDLAPVKPVSYRGTASTGEVHFALDFPADLTGRTLLLLEDIVDTGTTLDALVARAAARGAGRIRCATLLHKPTQHRGQHAPDWVGFEIPPEFVIGYGLDIDGQGRHLPGLYRPTTPPAQNP